MSIYGAKELAESFRTVRNNTITIAGEIPEDKYTFRAAPDTRSIAETFIHIAVSYRVQYQIHAVERRNTLAGFDFPTRLKEVQAEERRQRGKADIIDLLRSNGESWARWLEALPDEFLSERVAVPHGPTPTKSRFEMILSVKEHEMHHRGQLMLVERLIGIVPHLTRQMQARLAESQGASARS